MSPFRFSTSLAPLAFVACASLQACSESIALGSECRALDSECPARATPGEPDAFVPSGDAGKPDAARPLEAGPVHVDAQAPEAGATSDASYLPALSNLSFERKQGDPGDITTVNANLPGGTLIAPWYTCQPIGGGNTGLTAVRAEAMVGRLDGDGGVAEIVRPSDGETMVSIAPLANVFFPLIQEPAEPLAAGRRYSFALDVRALSSEPALWLQVWGADGCLPDELLAEGPPVDSAGWQTVCFDFTPVRSHRLVLLQAKSLVALGGERLLFDNLRAATDCQATSWR